MDDALWSNEFQPRYLPFALEHWDVLYPAAPLLRKQQIESQQRRQKATWEGRHGSFDGSLGVVTDVHHGIYRFFKWVHGIIMYDYNF